MNKFKQLKRKNNSSQTKETTKTNNNTFIKNYIKANDIINVNPIEALKINFANSTKIDFRNFYNRYQKNKPWIPKTLYGIDNFRVYKVYLYNQHWREKQKSSKRWRKPNFRDKSLSAYNLHKQSIVEQVDLYKKNRKKIWKTPNKFIHFIDFNKTDTDESLKRMRRGLKPLRKTSRNSFVFKRTYRLIKYFSVIHKTLFEQNIRMPKDGKTFAMTDYIHIGKFLHENNGTMNRAYIKKKNVLHF